MEKLHPETPSKTDGADSRFSRSLPDSERFRSELETEKIKSATPLRYEEEEWCEETV
jgi:hypothetical protein